MLKKTSLLLLFTIVGFSSMMAQSEEEKKIKADIWNNGGEEFKVTAIPERWQNESAVVIASLIDYNADFTTKMIGLSVTQMYVEKITSHYRIKLLDLASVKEYSELNFREKFVDMSVTGKAKSYFIIGVKVIKSNGTEKEIDLSKAVKTDSDSKNDLKIAIPDLEVGDIIDYFSASKDEYTAGYEGGLSDNYLFEGKYPVMKNRISITLPQEYTIDFKVFSTAPEFKKTQNGKDVTWALEDNMREKSQNILWTYEHRTAPEIRFVRNRYSGYNSTPEQVANNFASSFGYNVSNIGFIADFMNQNFKKEKDPEKIVNEVYCLLRNPIYLQAYFNIEQGHPLDVDYVNDTYFSLISKYLIKSKISHNIMVLPSRNYGEFKDQLRINADAVIRVNTTPPIYIPRMTPFALPNEIPYEYEGIDGVISTTLPKNMAADLTQKAVPASTYQQNTTTTTLNVSFNGDDRSELDVKRNVVSKGHNKSAHQYMVVTNYDYLKEYDQPKYQAESSHLIGGILKQYNKEKEKLAQRMTQDYNERDKNIKEDIEKSMEIKVKEYKNFQLKSVGMWPESPDNVYNDEFTTENLIKKAGPNYILELPVLIERQTEVTEKDKKRDRAIYMNYARSFVNEINFTIPEGYTVEGIENLNKKVENSTGGFESSATLEGNVLHIKAKKYYAANFFPSWDWPKMIEFLNAAVDFTNTKVLIKKL